MKKLDKVFRFLLSSAVLFGVWFLLSGKADALHLGFGLAGALVISATLHPWKLEQAAFPILRFAAFIPWELYQIFVSNLRVARLVLGPRSQIAPRIIRRKPPLPDQRGLTLLGCSITLTPGTLTVDITPDEMVVHALDETSAAEIEAEVMARRVGRVFEEPPA